MEKFHVIIITLALSLLLVSCATVPADRYNTQKGAAIGAGAGALIGQAIGGNTEGTLIGLASGAILGALVGNAVDQDYQAAREAAQYGKPVIFYDKSGQAVEAIPEGADEPNCQRVRKRIWENGELIKETVEEICRSPVPVVRYAPAPPPPPAYYYGWWGLPVVPRFSFYFGKSYKRGHKRHPPYRHNHSWYHRKGKRH